MVSNMLRFLVLNKIIVPDKLDLNQIRFSLI